FKSEWFDRRLRLNAAAFYNDYTNIQLTIAQVNQDGSIQVLVDNAAAGKSKGFEVEMQAVPFENFEIAAGLGYLDTKYTKLEPGAPVTLTSKFPRAPEWTLNLAAQYTLPLANYGSLTFRGDYSYRSKFY